MSYIHFLSKIFFIKWTLRLLFFFTWRIRLEVTKRFEETALFAQLKHTPPNYLSVFDHFVGLAMKGIILTNAISLYWMWPVNFDLTKRNVSSMLLSQRERVIAEKYEINGLFKWLHQRRFNLSLESFI